MRHLPDVQAPVVVLDRITVGVADDVPPAGVECAHTYFKAMAILADDVFWLWFCSGGAGCHDGEDSAEVEHGQRAHGRHA